MPVSFLTDNQRNRYAQFNGEPTSDQLARYFLLDERDRRLINSHRGDHSRLGFATQLCTARFLDAFLEDLADIPSVVVNYLARQLGLDQLSCFLYYRDSETRWDHAAEIRHHCGFREFTDAVMQFRMGDLPTSSCACLMADACNIGPEPLIHSDVPALRRPRLSWVRRENEAALGRKVRSWSRLVLFKVRFQSSSLVSPELRTTTGGTPAPNSSFRTFAQAYRL